jgi:hypothetical protein
MTMKRLFVFSLLFFAFLLPDRADPPQQGQLTGRRLLPRQRRLPPRRSSPSRSPRGRG